MYQEGGSYGSVGCQLFDKGCGVHVSEIDQLVDIRKREFFGIWETDPKYLVMVPMGVGHKQPLWIVLGLKKRLCHWSLNPK